MVKRSKLSFSQPKLKNFSISTHFSTFTLTFLDPRSVSDYLQSVLSLQANIEDSIAKNFGLMNNFLVALNDDMDESEGLVFRQR